MHPYLNTNFYKKWNTVEVGIIVSTGRTGTLFFEKFFNTNFNNVTALHEPHPDLFSLGTTSIRENWNHSKIQRNLKYSRFEIYSKLCNKKNTTFIESNNNIVLLLKDYLSVFPNAKILHIVRDPATYIMSAYSKKHGKTNYAVFDENDPRKRLQAKDFDGDLLGSKWDRLDRFEKLCWMWKKYNDLILEHQNNNNYKLVKYEDIFISDKKENTLKEIVQFFNIQSKLKVSEDILFKELNVKKNQSENYLINSPLNWSNEQKLFFKNLLISDINYYGYQLPF